MIDHCTGFIEGWWSMCCASHDDDYLAQIGQLLADGRLLDCVTHSLPSWAALHPALAAVAGVASAAIGAVMFVVVRVFGASFYRRAGKKETRSSDPVS